MTRKFAAAALALAVLAACKSNKGIELGDEVERVGDDATYSLHARNQTSNGNAVRIPEVHLKEKGYVAIHADSGGAPGQVLGVSALLDAGEQDVQVQLEEPLDKSADVWAMIHVEDNGNTSYDFPNGDQPAQVDGSVVTVKLRVTHR